MHIILGDFVSFEKSGKTNLYSPPYCDVLKKERRGDESKSEKI